MNGEWFYIKMEEFLKDGRPLLIVPAGYKWVKLVQSYYEKLKDESIVRDLRWNEKESRLDIVKIVPSPSALKYLYTNT